LAELLEVARWTGSARNTQPWEFVVVKDKALLMALSQLRTPINWVAAAPLAIALVMNGVSETSEAFDEGRVSERLLIAARLLGLGGGTAWYGDASLQAKAKELLGIPADRIARSMVVLGYPITARDPRPNPAAGGRRPLTELVSYDRLGQHQPG
jgi:nitroreductase